MGKRSAQGTCGVPSNLLPQVGFVGQAWDGVVRVGEVRAHVVGRQRAQARREDLRVVLGVCPHPVFVQLRKLDLVAEPPLSMGQSRGSGWSREPACGRS